MNLCLKKKVSRFSGRKRKLVWHNLVVFWPGCGRLAVTNLVTGLKRPLPEVICENNVYLCQYIWTANAQAESGCCICHPSLLPAKKIHNILITQSKPR